MVAKSMWILCRRRGVPTAFPDLTERGGNTASTFLQPLEIATSLPHIRGAQFDFVSVRAPSRSFAIKTLLRFGTLKKGALHRRFEQDFFVSEVGKHHFAESVSPIGLRAHMNQTVLLKNLQIAIDADARAVHRFDQF